MARRILAKRGFALAFCSFSREWPSLAVACTRIRSSSRALSLSLAPMRPFYRMQETLTAAPLPVCRYVCYCPLVLSSRPVGFQFGFQPMRQSRALVSSFKYKLLFPLRVHHFLDQIVTASAVEHRFLVAPFFFLFLNKLNDNIYTRKRSLEKFCRE